MTNVGAFLEQIHVLLDAIYDANDIRSGRHGPNLNAEFVKTFIETVGQSIASPEFAVHVYLFLTHQNTRTLGTQLSSDVSRIIETNVVFPDHTIQRIVDATWKAANRMVDLDTLNRLARMRVSRIVKSAYTVNVNDVKYIVDTALQDIGYTIDNAEFEKLATFSHSLSVIITSLRNWHEDAHNPVIILLRDLILFKSEANTRRIAEVAFAHTQTLQKDMITMDDVLRDTRALVTEHTIPQIPDDVSQTFEIFNAYTVQKLVHVLDTSHIYRARFDAKVTGMSCGKDLKDGEGCSFGDYGLVSAFDKPDESDNSKNSETPSSDTPTTGTTGTTSSHVMTLWSNDRYAQLDTSSTIDIDTITSFGSLFNYDVVIGGQQEIGSVHVGIDDFVMTPISAIRADMVMIPKYVFMTTYHVPPVLYLTLDSSDGPRSKVLRSGPTQNTTGSHIVLTLATTASHYFIYKELQYNGIKSSIPFRLSRFRIGIDFPGLADLDLYYNVQHMDRVQVLEVTISTSSSYEYLIYVSVLDNISVGSTVTFYNLPSSSTHYIKHGTFYYVERIGNRLTTNRAPNDNTERYFTLVRNDGQVATETFTANDLATAQTFIVINSLQSTVVLRFE